MISIMSSLLRLAGAVVVASAVVAVSAQSPNSPAVPFLGRVEADTPGRLETHGEPGIAVAFIDGCQASIRTYGVANRERATPVRPDTVFNLGSISKTLTAWTVMTLV